MADRKPSTIHRTRSHQYFHLIQRTDSDTLLNLQNITTLVCFDCLSKHQAIFLLGHSFVLDCRLHEPIPDNLVCAHPHGVPHKPANQQPVSAFPAADRHSHRIDATRTGTFRIQPLDAPRKSTCYPTNAFPAIPVMLASWGKTSLKPGDFHSEAHGFEKTDAADRGAACRLSVGFGDAWAGENV